MYLKDEFDFFLDDEDGVGIAHWILIRHATEELSDYWNDVTKEAVGGPKYKYNDFLVRAYSAPAAFGMAMTADGVTRIEPGDIPTDSIMYYVKASVPVAGKDVIYELDWKGSTQPTAVVYSIDEVDHSRGIVGPTKKAEVLKVIDYSSDTAGEIEFKKIFAEEHML